MPFLDISSHFLLQYYDEVFEERVDIPQKYVPANKEMIMVLPRVHKGGEYLTLHTAQETPCTK